MRPVQARRAVSGLGGGADGFTVIELLVVLAAVALLLSVAAPRYIQHLDHARETALKDDLHQMRRAIDQFYGDRGRYPVDLEELVTRRYLRAIPEDPLTGSVSSWVTSPPPGSVAAAPGQNPGASPGIADVHSGAVGASQDGSAYAAW